MMLTKHLMFGKASVTKYVMNMHLLRKNLSKEVNFLSGSMKILLTLSSRRAYVRRHRKPSGHISDALRKYAYFISILYVSLDETFPKAFVCYCKGMKGGTVTFWFNLPSILS